MSFSISIDFARQCFGHIKIIVHGLDYFKVHLCSIILVMFEGKSVSLAK